MNLPEVRNQQKLGKLGESLAAKYLQKRGYSIIERNYRVRYGEIDIIARDSDTLVFVEVKTRTGTAFGLPEDAVTPAKLREIIKTASIYTAKHSLQDMSQRIDVVAVLMNNNCTVQEIRHMENVTG